MGLGSVKFSGGEPLIDPEMEEILDFIKEEELGLTVETNGTVCTPALVKKIKECKNAYVSVSLDGPEAGMYEWVCGVKGSFDDAVNGRLIGKKE